MSTLRVSNLQNEASSNNQISLGTDGFASINGVAYPSSGPLSGTRNRIINGDMRIDQRNAGASVTIGTSATYTLDRWEASAALASKFSVQQSTTAPAGFTNSLLVTSLAATTPGSSDQYSVRHKIEGFNASDLGWGATGAQTTTLSFWVRSSLTGTFGGAITNSGFSRSYPFAYSISSADTWEKKTVSITGDTSGTWLTNNGIGIIVNFSLGAGSSLSGTAGSWTGSDFRSATGATSVVATNGATFYITGVQLEAGSVATPFERRSYGQELALCQRYYVNMGATGYVGPVPAASSSSTAFFSLQLPVRMRANPALEYDSLSDFTINEIASQSGTPTTFAIDRAGALAPGLRCTGGVTYGNNKAFIFYTNNEGDKLAFTAEL